MRLYISHSTVDREAVRELVNVLDSAGHEAWFDLWLLPGQNWRQQVMSAIENSEAFVFVLTPESVETEGCRWELSQAIEQDKPIIPVLMHAKTRIPQVLTRYPYVDLTAGPTPEAVARLMAALYNQARPAPAVQTSQSIRETVETKPVAATDESKALSSENRVNIIFAIIGAIALAVSIVLNVLAHLEGLVGIEPASFGLGLLVLFVTASAMFTLLRRLTMAVAIFFGLELALTVIYLSVDTFSFLDYAMLVSLLLVTYTIGRLRLPLWPWFSYRIWQQRRRFQARIAAGRDARESAAILISLLNAPIGVTPYGATAAMRALAAHGFSVEAFDGRVSSNPRREKYRDIIRRSALEKLAKTHRLADVLAIAELKAFIPDEQAALQATLNTVRNSQSAIERVRVFAHLLWLLNNAMDDLSPEKDTLRGQQHQALLHIGRLVYQAITPAEVTQYWTTYDALKSVIGHMPAVGPPPADEQDLRQAIHYGLLQVTAILELMRHVEEQLPAFPEKERRWYHSIMGTGLIHDQLLSTDYQERQPLLGREIGRLQILASSQPAHWLAVDKGITNVIEHDNPWCTITNRLVEHLERIQQLDTQYVATAARQLSSVLKGIDSIQAIAELEQRLVSFTISGDSLGPMLEDTVQALLAIGNDTRAALALPQGTYHHRQTLIDAQDKSNQLRNSLRTRYVTQEPRDWAESVQTISTILDEYLNRQSDIAQTTYSNPYIVGNPLQPKNAALFKGRIDLAQEIVDKLRGDTRPTLVLHGARRMGKTSFLLQLQNLLQGRGDYIPVFFNAQEPGSRQNDAGFFYTMARAIYIQMRRLARGRRIKPPDLAQYEERPYTTITTWVEDEIVPLLDQHILLVTIDEFEKLGSAIHDGELTEKVLDYLRHMMQHSENLLFLFCGVETLQALGPNAASYFISVQAIEISYLSEAAAEELIRNPNPEAGNMPAYDDEVVDAIIRLTHRQPYLIQAICSQLIDLANVNNLRQIDLARLEEVLPSVFTTNSLFFLNIWEDAQTAGQAILTALAGGFTELPKEQVNSPAGQGLIKRRVICPAGDGLYAIEIPLVQQWVAQQV